MANWVRVNKIEMEKLPVQISKSVLYKWARENKYPGLFKRVGSMIWTNLNQLVVILEKGD